MALMPWHVFVQSKDCPYAGQVALQKNSRPGTIFRGPLYVWCENKLFPMPNFTGEM